MKNREKDKLSGRITDTQGKMRNYVIDGLRCSGLLSDPVWTFFIFFLVAEEYLVLCLLIVLR